MHVTHATRLTMCMRDCVDDVCSLDTEALAAYKQSMEVDPLFEVAMDNYGILLLSMQRSDEAILHYEDCVAKSTHHRFALGYGERAL